MDGLWNDIHYALRDLLKSRGFSVVAVLTLALGIGAPAAMFSVINAVVLRPLPFKDPGRLMHVREYKTTAVGASTGELPLSYPDFADVRASNHSFEGIAAYTSNEYTATGFGEPRHVAVENVAPGLFEILGMRPAIGRSFARDEDQPGHHVVILSDTFWRVHFNATPNVIGRSIDLNGRPFTVIGVMPRGFQFPIRAEASDMWLTFSRLAEADEPGDTPMTAQRGNHSVDAIARLKPGVSVSAANADLASISHNLASAYPDSNKHFRIAAKPELEFLIGDTRPALFILFGVVGMVLLIACANVANLLLSRSIRRAREIAIRAAVGASRSRIIRQLLTECVVISIVGGAIGLVLAQGLLNLLVSFYPANLPRVQEIGIDSRVIFFTAGLAFLTGILFGLMPALRVSSPNLMDAVREGGRTTTSGIRHNRLRSILVVAETALGVVLLIGAALLIHSLDRLSRAPLGFNSQHVLTAQFDLSETRYNSDQQNRFINELISRLRILPGVVNAAGSIPLPLHNDGWSVTFTRVDHPVPMADQPAANFYVVVPGFFQTMQMPLVRGRVFDETDQRNSRPVIIVSRAFANRFFRNEDPIGKRIQVGAGEGPARASYKTREIVGVVEDIRTSDIAHSPGAAMYMPLCQLMFGPPVLTIRTNGDPRTVASEVNHVLASMDRDAPLYDVRPMDDYLVLDLGRARFQTLLLSFFAAIALLLTGIGLYGVVAYAVTQRTQEIGLRLALGAARTEVLAMVLKRGIMLTIAGLALGLVASVIFSRLLESLLYDIRPWDPITYVVVCAVLSAVAILASYLPALRATRINPIAALRYE